MIAIETVIHQKAKQRTIEHLHVFTWSSVMGIHVYL